nr:hypothetical protein [uncultured Flavobacterium sp.]
MEDLKFKPLDGKPFTVKMDSSYFQKRDVVVTQSKKFLVVKTYKFNWWRKFLFKLGFKFHSAELKEIKDNNGN